MRVSSIEVSKQMHHYIALYLQQDLEQTNPSRSDYFLKSEGIRCVFQ